MARKATWSAPWAVAAAALVLAVFAWQSAAAVSPRARTVNVATVAHPSTLARNLCNGGITGEPPPLCPPERDFGRLLTVTTGGAGRLAVVDALRHV